MIRTFKHKGLKRLFRDGDSRGVPSFLVEKLNLMLGRLDAANHIEVMNLRGYRLHPLKGSLGGYWSITVTGNYRLIFRFDDHAQNAFSVDLIDYH